MTRPWSKSRLRSPGRRRDRAGTARREVAHDRRIATPTGQTEAERFHGSGTRGISSVTSSPLFEGRFGRLFRRLPVFTVDDGFLQELADDMVEGVDTTPPDEGQPQPPSWGADPGAPTGGQPAVLDGDNDAIPSGYTYLGQFIDHDVTFDPTSMMGRANDPDSLTDFRTPRFDLDSLYGRGPADDPFLYDQESPGGLKLLLGQALQDDGSEVAGEHDLLRNRQGRAMIGDPRNDENTIVGQLHVAFVRLHNRVVDHAIEQGVAPGDRLKEAQRLVRWHYQWVVVHDYLRRTIGDTLLEKLLPVSDGVEDVKLRYYRWRKNPFMPVEFSVAAFRFGHSQVRGGYRINNVVARPTFTATGSDAVDRREDFRGFRALPPQWQVAWPNFFELDDTPPQPSRLINSKLAGPLFTLPDVDPADTPMRSLALRNLRRGVALQLPAGQDVARAIGADVLTAGDLGFEEKAPLWVYVLKEADKQEGGKRLGQVGGRIVGETLLGLLNADRLSYLSVMPGWRPEQPLAAGENFTMADLLRFAVPDRTTR